MKNNLIANLGDCHFDINDYLLDSQLNFFKNQFVPYLHENKIDTIIQHGDLFDNRKSMSIKAMNQVLSLFENELKDFKFYCFPGNHDVVMRNSNEIHSLKLLSQFSNVTVFEEITKVKIKNKTFLMVPWLYDLNIFQEYIKENKVDDVDVVCGHFDIISGKMGKNTYSKTGLTKELLHQFPKVYSGHYHSISIIENDGKEIRYLGSPYQLNHGDSEEERGFHILNCDDMSLKFVENDTSIKFVTLNYPEEIKEEKIKGNIVNVFVDESENIDTDKIQTYIESINKFKPVKEPTKRIIGGTESKDINVNELKVKSLKELFDVFVSQIKMEDEIKEDVLKEINSLYMECQKSE